MATRLSVQAFYSLIPQPYPLRTDQMHHSCASLSAGAVCTSIYEKCFSSIFRVEKKAGFHCIIQNSAVFMLRYALSVNLIMAITTQLVCTSIKSPHCSPWSTCFLSIKSQQS